MSVSASSLAFFIQPLGRQTKQLCAPPLSPSSSLPLLPTPNLLSILHRPNPVRPHLNLLIPPNPAPAIPPHRDLERLPLLVRGVGKRLRLVGGRGARVRNGRRLLSAQSGERSTSPYLLRRPHHDPFLKHTVVSLGGDPVLPLPRKTLASTPSHAVRLPFNAHEQSVAVFKVWFVALRSAIEG